MRRIDVDSFVEDAFSIAGELNVLRIGAISNECRAFLFLRFFVNFRSSTKEKGKKILKI